MIDVYVIFRYDYISFVSGFFYPFKRLFLPKGAFILHFVYLYEV
nr:MAG TPA: hypothetical protein [Bacteriophage sp.]DAY82830.1 MAG TPA: hypothetical protein [Caudoviricetes sp.]